MSRFTLWGLEQYDETLFDNIALPVGLEKQLVIGTINETSGDLYPYYQVPSRFKTLVENWFTRHYRGFERMLLALNENYSPIENYDRFEDSTETPDLTRTRQASGQDKTTAGGSDSNTSHFGSDTETETQVSAFNSGGYEDYNKNSGNSSQDTNASTTYGRTDTTDYGRNDTERETGTTTRHSHIHGNIGIVDNVTLINRELELRKFDIYKQIAIMFEHDLLIQVY